MLRSVARGGENFPPLRNEFRASNHTPDVHAARFECLVFACACAGVARCDRVRAPDAFVAARWFRSSE
jgi:hypothetical protein